MTQMGAPAEPASDASARLYALSPWGNLLA
jgi:hypothetical protein